MIKHNFFQELLEGVFGGTTVRLTKVFLPNEFIERDCVSYDGSLFSDIKDYTAAYRAKYESLFTNAFCNSEAAFIRKGGINIPNQKEKIVEDSINYLEKFDVYIFDDLRKAVGDSPLCLALNTAFCDIFLPVIFRNKDKYEQFDESIVEIKNKLKTMFASFELGNLVSRFSKSKDLITIFDSRYYNNEYNTDDHAYAIPIDRSNVEDQIIVHCPSISFNIEVESNNHRSLFDDLTSTYKKYPFKEDDNFIEPWILQLEASIPYMKKYSSDAYYSLSDCYIPSIYFIPRYFYFITSISQGTVQRYKEETEATKLASLPSSLTDSTAIDENISNKDVNAAMNELRQNTLNSIKNDICGGEFTLEMFIDNINRQAVSDFRSIHYNDLQDYYSYVLSYIEDVIRRIATADYCNAACEKHNDDKALQKYAEHFNINYCKIINHIKNNSECYEYIEKAILEFVSFLERSSARLASEFNMFLKGQLQEHYGHLKEYIDTGKLQQSIELRKEYLASYYNTTAHKTQVQTENGIINYSEMFRLLDEAQKINPYERIINVLNTYCHDLEVEIEKTYGCHNSSASE